MAESELNELPDGWIWTTLDGVTDMTRQRRHPQEYPDLPYIGLENVESDTMKLLGIQSASELKSMADYFQPGDVLYARLRPYLNKVLRPEFEGLCSSEFIIFRELDNLSNKYVQYLINSWDFVSFAMSKITGDRPRVDMGDLGDYPFPLAPLNEQRRIVDEIEAQFSRLDTWLEVMQKLREQLPRLRASILKAAVEGRLVEQDPDDEPAEVMLQRILDERRRKWEADYLADLQAKGKPAPKDNKWKEQYPEPEAPDIAGLPELPEGWVWASLDQCSWHSGYGTSQRSDYDASGAPVLRIPNVVNGRIDFTDLKFATDSSVFDEAQALQINDLLIIRTNGSKALLGRSALVLEEFTSPHYYASYLIRYRLLSTNHTPQWIAVVWNSHFVRDWIDQIASTSAGQYNINIANLNKTPIPLPPPNQQVLIIEDVESRFSVIDRLLENIDVNIKRAARMRQSVLKKAFEGRLVEQDPNDEPASKLLERIQEERQRRAEEEKQKPRQQRERKVSTQTERKSLYETLKEAGKPLSARDLFQQAGFTHDTVDDFYEELRAAVHELQTIRTKQNRNNEIFLEVTG